MTNIDFTLFKDQRVFVCTNFFEAYDGLYVIGLIRDELSRAGALLVDSEFLAEIMVEPRSGALSVDGAEALVGIANTAVPVPFAGSIWLPEIALYKSQKHYSIARIALLAYRREDGRHVYSSGPSVGRARMFYYKFLGYITYSSTDIPEKIKPGGTASP